MSSNAKQKLTRKLCQYPADDDSAAPVSCAPKKKLIYDVQAVSQYTVIQPSCLNLKEVREKLRSHSCFPSNYSFMVQEAGRLASYIKHLDLAVIRVSSQAKTEIMLLAPKELNVIFREKEKVPFLAAFCSTSSNQVLSQTRPLIEGMRKMVKGGHIIDMVYVEKDKVDMKEQLITYRRLKYILSQLYHSLISLETLGNDVSMNAEMPKITEPSEETPWEVAWRSGRKKYFDQVVEQLSESDRQALLQDRKARLRKLDKKRQVYNNYSSRGREYCVKEADILKKQGVCKICDLKNIPFDKLHGHSERCQKIKEIQGELLKVNQWLIAECKKAALLKEKLHTFNNPTTVEKNGKGGIKVKARGSTNTEEKECLTPNPRLVKSKLNLDGIASFRTFAKQKDPSKTTEKESVGSLKTNEEGPSYSSVNKTVRKCNSSEELEAEKRAKENPKEDKAAQPQADLTQKAEPKRFSMSEDDNPRVLHSQLSSSDEETDKKEAIKPQRFSHFKQYKLPSGNYTNPPEANNPGKPESSSTIRSNQDLGLSKEQSKEEPAIMQPEVNVKEQHESPKVPSLTVEVEKPKDTTQFLDSIFDSDSESSSSNHSSSKEAQVDIFAHKPKLSRFNKEAQQCLANKSKDDEKTILTVQPRVTSQRKEEKTEDLAEEVVQQSSKIESTGQKASELGQINEKKSSSDDGSCFGDKFDLDGEEEMESVEEPEPAKPSPFKPSAFKASSPQNSSKQKEPEPQKQPAEEVKFSSFKTSIPLNNPKKDQPEGLPDSPDFLENLLDGSDTESIRQKTTSRSGVSNKPPPEEEKELDQPPPLKLRPTTSVQLPRVQGLTEPEETTEKVGGGFSILGMLKGRTQANSVAQEEEESKKQNTLTALPSNEEVKQNEDAKKDDANNATKISNSQLERKAIREKFKAASKKPQFQTQIREAPQKKEKTDLEEKKEIDHTTQEFKLLKMALDCLTQIGWYGEEVVKNPLGVNLLADTQMRDFLNHVENSDLYLPDVKIPSLKIKEMVKKRWDLIQEIKKIKQEDDRKLQAKGKSFYNRLQQGESSFRVGKGKNGPINFNPLPISRSMQPFHLGDAHNTDNETKSLNATPVTNSKAKEPSGSEIEQAPKPAPPAQPAQGKSMLQLLRDRNLTFTASSSKQKKK